MINRQARASLAALIFLTACGGPPADEGENAQMAMWTVRPGIVEADPANPRALKGSFYIGPANPGEPAIASDGFGGACLIADMTVIGIPNLGPGASGHCTKDIECTDALPAVHRSPQAPPPKAWVGYCHANRCWTRPGGQGKFCTVPRFNNNGQAWPTGTQNIPHLGGYVDTREVAQFDTANRPIRWAVLGCLAPSGQPLACGGDSPDKLVRVSTPRAHFQPN